jgi:hypothetical protein
MGVRMVGGVTVLFVMCLVTLFRQSLALLRARLLLRIRHALTKSTIRTRTPRCRAEVSGGWRAM